MWHFTTALFCCDNPEFVLYIYIFNLYTWSLHMKLAFCRTGHFNHKFLLFCYEFQIQICTAIYTCCGFLTFIHLFFFFLFLRHTFYFVETWNIVLFTSTSSTVAPVLQKRLERWIMCTATVSHKKNMCVFRSNVLRFTCKIAENPSWSWRMEGYCGSESIANHVRVSCSC